MSKRRSDSLWYPRYVGDYQRKTAHLSLVEHGAYALLLDHYYSTGKPLPANASRLQTICRAFASEEVDAMHAVLRDFFVQDGDVYRNYRADEELLKRCDISEKRREAAQARHAFAGANAPPNAGANGHAKRDTATATATTIITDTAKSKKSTRSRAFPLSELEGEFEAWWKLVPGKNGSKQDALAAYAKRRSMGHSQEEIEDGVRCWSAIVTQTEGFCPLRDIHASTWLSKGRWLDDDHKTARAKPRPQMSDQRVALGLDP